MYLFVNRQLGDEDLASFRQMKNMMMHSFKGHPLTAQHKTEWDYDQLK